MCRFLFSTAPIHWFQFWNLILLRLNSPLLAILMVWLTFFTCHCFCLQRDNFSSWEYLVFTGGASKFLPIIQSLLVFLSDFFICSFPGSDPGYGTKYNTMLRMGSLFQSLKVVLHVVYLSMVTSESITFGHGARCNIILGWGHGDLMCVPLCCFGVPFS